MEQTAEIMWYFGVLVVLVAALSLAVFQMPGTWLILLCAGVYDYCHSFERLGWWVLGMMALVAAAAETAEFLAAAKGAQKSGASRGASWGALGGGLFGMILLAPVPFIGPILGGLIGCFLGAFLMERRVHGDLNKGAKVGVAAVIGRIIGMIIKTSAAFLMAGITFSFATYYLFLLFKNGSLQ